MPDFHLRSREVAESFIQSIVVLDDFAHFGEQSREPVDQLKAPELGDTSHSMAVHSQECGALDGNRNGKDVPLNAKAVIDRFAELGSVCAVLNPGPQEEFQQKVFKAAVRADIVVLDWKIGDSYGDETLEIIRRLLADDQDRRRLRLLAIYTGEPDLEDMVNKTREIIDDFYTREELAVESHALRISKGPVHAVILAKRGTNLVNQAHQSQVVEEIQLPDRLIDEFARITEGLLSNVALTGLAALRVEAHKLLLKFDPSLDAAYLGHRLLLPYPQDAEDHVIDALGAEIHSILEDAKPSKHADITAVREWLVVSVSEGILDLSKPDIFPGENNLLGKYGELLLGGQQSDKNKLEKCETTEIFSTDSVAATHSNHRFAALLNLKSRYSKLPPRLSLGAILRTGDGKDRQYFLCLQPKCDSVRLKGETGFPLLPLVIQNDNKGSNLVIECEGSQWMYIKVSPKPSSLTIRSFKPIQNPPGEVVASNRSGSFYFKGVDNAEYHWIGEMKDEHALKIAGELAAGLSRPGPNDAEWLRRASRR